jgi:hypothetical protein
LLRRVSLVVLLAVPFGSPVLAQFDYMREMPTAAAVKEAMAHSDPLQAAARRYGAFVELQEIGAIFIGRYDALTNFTRMSPAERELETKLARDAQQLRDRMTAHHATDRQIESALEQQKWQHDKLRMDQQAEFEREREALARYLADLERQRNERADRDGLSR